MKVLLDACVWGGAVRELQEAGHDVVWCGDWPNDPGDREILDQARQEGRVLVTLDKDFGELAVVRRVRHAGIVRLVNLRATQHGRVCLSILDQHGDDLERGALITVEPGRVRLRPPAEPEQ